MAREDFTHFIFVLALVLLAHPVSVWAAIAPANRLTTTAAVIPVASDENESDTFSRILVDIGESQELAVYLVAVNSTDRKPLANVIPMSCQPMSRSYDRNGPIAVIYPNVGEPYHSMFSQIIEGIKDTAKTRVVSQIPPAKPVA